MQFGELNEVKTSSNLNPQGFSGLRCKDHSDQFISWVCLENDRDQKLYCSTCIFLIKEKEKEREQLKFTKEVNIFGETEMVQQSSGRKLPFPQIIEYKTFLKNLYNFCTLEEGDPERFNSEIVSCLEGGKQQEKLKLFMGNVGVIREELFNSFKDSIQTIFDELQERIISNIKDIQDNFYLFLQSELDQLFSRDTLSIKQFKERGCKLVLSSVKSATLSDDTLAFDAVTSAISRLHSGRIELSYAREHSQKVFKNMKAELETKVGQNIQDLIQKQITQPIIEIEEKFHFLPKKGSIAQHRSVNFSYLQQNKIVNMPPVLGPTSEQSFKKKREENTWKLKDTFQTKKLSNLFYVPPGVLPKSKDLDQENNLQSSEDANQTYQLSLFSSFSSSIRTNLVTSCNERIKKLQSPIKEQHSIKSELNTSKTEQNQSKQIPLQKLITNKSTPSLQATKNGYFVHGSLFNKIPQNYTSSILPNAKTTNNPTLLSNTYSSSSRNINLVTKSAVEHNHISFSSQNISLGSKSPSDFNNIIKKSNNFQNGISSSSSDNLIRHNTDIQQRKSSTNMHEYNSCTSEDDRQSDSTTSKSIISKQLLVQQNGFKKVRELSNIIFEKPIKHHVLGFIRIPNKLIKHKVFQSHKKSDQNQQQLPVIENNSEEDFGGFVIAEKDGFINSFCAQGGQVNLVHRERAHERNIGISKGKTGHMFFTAGYSQNTPSVKLWMLHANLQLNELVELKMTDKEISQIFFLKEEFAASLSTLTFCIWSKNEDQHNNSSNFLRDSNLNATPLGTISQPNISQFNISSNQIQFEAQTNIKSNQNFESILSQTSLKAGLQNTFTLLNTSNSNLPSNNPTNTSNNNNNNNNTSNNNNNSHIEKPKTNDKLIIWNLEFNSHKFENGRMFNAASIDLPSDVIDVAVIDDELFAFTRNQLFLYKFSKDFQSLSKTNSQKFINIQSGDSLISFRKFSTFRNQIKYILLTQDGYIYVLTDSLQILSEKSLKDHTQRGISLQNSLIFERDCDLPENQRFLYIHQKNTKVIFILDLQSQKILDSEQYQEEINNIFFYGNNGLHLTFDSTSLKVWKPFPLKQKALSPNSYNFIQIE